MPIRRSLAFRAVIGCLLVGALVSVPSSAEAKSFAHEDPRGDLQDLTKQGWPARPDQVYGDILRMNAAHTKRRIRVRLVLAELKPWAPSTRFTAEYRFWTSRHVRSVGLVAGPRTPTGKTQMYRQSDGGGTVPCAIRHSLDYAHNVVIVSFPRRCLGNPRWVRISASTTTEAYDEGRMLVGAYADNAQRTGLDFAVHQNYSPRIRRG